MTAVCPSLLQVSNLICTSMYQYKNTQYYLQQLLTNIVQIHGKWYPSNECLSKILKQSKFGCTYEYIWWHWTLNPGPYCHVHRHFLCSSCCSWHHQAFCPISHTGILNIGYSPSMWSNCWCPYASSAWTIQCRYIYFILWFAISSLFFKLSHQGSTSDLLTNTCAYSCPVPKCLILASWNDLMYLYKYTLSIVHEDYQLVCTCAFFSERSL